MTTAQLTPTLQPPLLRYRQSDYMLFTGMLLGLLLMLCITLALQLPLYAVGLVYAPFFIFLSVKYPPVALALIFALAPFQQSLSGGSRASGALQFSIAEINLMLMIPALILRCLQKRRAPLLGPLTLPVLLYFAACVISTRQEWRGSAALTSLAQMFLYLVVVVLLFSLYSDQWSAFTPAFYGLIAMGVFLTFLELALRSNEMLGFKKNGIGASVACAILVAADFWMRAQTKQRRAKLLGVIAFLMIGLVLSLSRGAWVSLVAGLSVMLLLRGNIRLLVQGALVLIPLVAVAYFLLPDEKKFYVTNFDAKTNWNVRARIYNDAFARERFEKNPLWGSGVGLRKEFDATNIYWTTLAETGVVGLGAFALLHVVFYRMVWKLRRKFEQKEVYFSALTLGAAMVMMKLAHGMVDHYWSRGQLTIVWACAGMTVGAYYYARRKQTMQRLAQVPIRRKLER